MANSKLNKKQIEELDAFVFKVSMDGFTYAAKNYPPKDKTLRNLLKIDEVCQAEDALDLLMGEYGLEFS